MEFDFEKESSELVEQIICLWQGHSRCNSIIDLEESRAHSQQMAAFLESRLQAEFPNSLVVARIDGHKRIELCLKPR